MTLLIVYMEKLIVYSMHYFLNNSMNAQMLRIACVYS